MTRAPAPRPPAFVHGAPCAGLVALAALSGCTSAKTEPTPSPSPAAELMPPAPPAAAPAPAPASASAAAAPAPAPAPAPAAPRIWSKGRFAWIHPQPGASRAWLGYLALGSSVPLKGGSVEAAQVKGFGGCDAWYAVEPRGYVCAGAAATIDEKDPAVVILRRDAADVSSPWPYQYGESIGAPRYDHIPTRAEQQAVEWDLERHEAKVEKARAAAGDPEAIAAIDKALVGVDLAPAGEGPPELLPFGPLVREARRSVQLGSTIAFVRSFESGGRTFVLTADQAIIPKDRIKLYPRSTFHGVTLGEDVKLPLAFFRQKPRAKWKTGDDGKLVKTDETFPRLGWVGLTGARIEQDGKTFVETKESGVYVLAEDAQIVEAVTEAPWLKAKDPSTSKWVDVRVLNGTFVAYEGLRPVYATMISPGRGGVPYPGIDPLKTASTPVGLFRVDGKFRTASMVSSSDENLVHAEVNWVLNFSGPHALHGAYWHDAWGEPKSGGCVNLAPIDAKWVFDWTDPSVPEGWHGMRAVKEFGQSTIVRIRR
ncbi:L,D-transpeptidase [Polyangium spumosum]|uniref:L,D-transpeptidase family protein n=1 Tax=Polyangium spumosum TaxID=889282 RepID=A0A6N7PX20_9BACT|nr:L,D-transpeptidase [Polyangium spumosum]MRG96543.1 L,D-transpeptidase family protein [Polyangium spumosum]